MTTHAIRSGKPWLDTAGKPIQAHGGSLYYENGTFYFYGENKEGKPPDSTIQHYGVRAYSSPDLYSWKDEGILLAHVENDVSSPLHPTRVVERPHILFNERTKKYVMWVKLMGTTEAPRVWYVQYMGVAVADVFTGPYTLIKTFKPLGMHSGDFDLYKEPREGKAYIIFGRVHTEVVIADLTDDYLGVTGNYSSHFPFPSPPQAREAPAFFKVGHRYYMITSGTTGYNPNPADYAVSELMHGPWKSLGDPCFGDTKRTTFDSQISSVFVHPHKKNLFIAVADRWNAKDSASSTYVWLPITIEGKIKERTPVELEYSAWLPFTVEGERLSIQWRDEWRIEDFE